MIEKYITVLAIIFIVHVLITSCYLLTGKKYNKLIKDNAFFPTRFFKYKDHNWKIFWLSTLWLVVSYENELIILWNIIWIELLKFGNYIWIVLNWQV